MSVNDPSKAVPIDWLVRLRWFFLVGELLACAVTLWGLGGTLLWAPIVGVFAIAAGSNVALGTVARKVAIAHGNIMGAVLVVDTVLLSVLLASSGGASNPFTVLYLVHITLSAVALRATWTALIAVLSVAGYGVLFLLSPEDHSHHGPQMATFGSHLQGMWAAFALATVLTGFFVGSISRWLAAQREQIASLRETSARNARLAALTTLAAGAAHELNTPLGTIAVAAHEAVRRSRAMAGTESISEDLDLILEEVDRCQVILHRMSAHAEDLDDRPRPLTLAELKTALAEELGPERNARVDVRGPENEASALVPSGQVVSSIVALVRNGLDASGPLERVLVEVAQDHGRTAIVVRDRGTGIPDAVMQRLGDPFFTTKEPGAGLGLGVFLARAVIESRGGTLEFKSIPGSGTEASIRLPREGEATT